MGICSATQEYESSKEGQIKAIYYFCEYSIHTVSRLEKQKLGPIRSCHTVRSVALPPQRTILSLMGEIFTIQNLKNKPR